MTSLQRKERPMIFSGSSVRGILVDRKWATRRVVKGAAAKWLIDHSPEWVASKANELCPYGQVGDLLWVRENFWQAGAWSASYPEGDVDTWLGSDRLHFAADGEPPNEPNRHYPNGLRNGSFAAADPHRIWRSRPSIHMPRWASRILLEITDVRVERLQAITEEQAKAEGLRWHSLYQQWGGVESHPASRPECPQWRWYENPITALSQLWESINGAGSWDANPWVWVVEFKRIQP